MSSLYLNRLSEKDRDTLIRKLHESQGGNCFICEKPLDVKLHDLEIDHVKPLKLGGKDDPLNFALTHSSCNESKQDADLTVARILAKFKRIQETCLQNNRGPNLSDILKEYEGTVYEFNGQIDDDKGYIEYSLSKIGDNNTYRERIYTDKTSGFKYFFAELPIEYIHHDDRINPRSIGQNIVKS